MVDIETKNLIISKINEIYNKYPDIKNPDSYVKKMVRINDLHSYELEALERKKQIMRLPKLWMFLIPLIIIPLCGRYLASGAKKYNVLCFIFLGIALFLFIGAILDIKFMSKRITKIDMRIDELKKKYESDVALIKSQDSENYKLINCRKNEIEQLYYKYRELISYEDFLTIVNNK